VRHAPVIRPATGGALNLPRRESGSNLAPRHFHGPALVLPCATVRLRRYRVWRSESTVVGGASGHRIPPGRPGHWRSSPAACRRSRPSPRFTPHRFIFDIGLMATTSAIGTYRVIASSRRGSDLGDSAALLAFDDSNGSVAADSFSAVPLGGTRSRSGCNGYGCDLRRGKHPPANCEIPDPDGDVQKPKRRRDLGHKPSVLSSRDQIRGTG
jgi:hypothetical protein